MLGIKSFDAEQTLQENWDSSAQRLGRTEGADVVENVQGPLIVAYRHGLLALESWDASLGQIVIKIMPGRVMYSGLASGYSISFEVENGAAEQYAQAIAVSGRGAVDGVPLATVSPAGGVALF